MQKSVREEKMQHDVLIEKIINRLKTIYDPEIPVNIYDLGLIYNIECQEHEEETKCIITMTLTSPSCPVSEDLLEQVRDVAYFIEGIDDLEVFPALVFDPPWSQDKMSDEAKLSLGML